MSAQITGGKTIARKTPNEPRADVARLRDRRGAGTTTVVRLMQNTVRAVAIH
jgi:hypothetical protein